MKSLISFSSTLLVISILCLSSCNGRKNMDTPNGLTFETINVSEIYHMDNDSTKPSCTLKINYTYPGSYANSDVLAKIQSELNLIIFEDESLSSATPEETVKEYTKAYVENYKSEALSRFPDWKESGETEDYFSFYKKIDTKILFDKGDILSYQASAIDYKGGANSSTYIVNTVFDLKTGKTITEDDIFTISYQDKLNQIMVAYVLKQNNVKTVEEMLDLGYIGIEELSSNNNFAVNDKGISYVINAGEYAAPSIGEIHIDLTYQDIKFLLKPDSPISHLYN